MKLSFLCEYASLAILTFLTSTTAKPLQTPLHNKLARGTCLSVSNPKTPTPAWSAAVTKGHKLYQALQAKLNANPTPPDNDTARPIYNENKYRKEFSSRERTLPSLMIPFLRYVGAPTNADYQENWVIWGDQAKAEAEAEDYRSWFYSQGGPSGTIIPFNNYRRGGPLHWSDAVFYQWEKYNAENPERIAELRYIMRHEIENTDTIAIIEHACENVSRQKSLNWRWMPSDEAFYALLATPNGVGVPYMLTDRSIALGKLTIASIETQCPCGKIFCFMSFTLAGPA
ncbi:hypothetical protein MMC06_006584 [Schaereria dolodes]|nr:hypothetical protein [Schaereria dolodes]